MCSGKTTVGESIAYRLGWDFVDTDRFIEKLEGRTIPQIFEESGEEYFRRRELDLLKELRKREHVVISTGGGLGAKPEAMELMKSSGLVVWLKIDFETFLKRCGKDTSRPLLKRGKEELFELFRQRSQIYRLAHLKLKATEEISELVKVILQACKTHPSTL